MFKLNDYSHILFREAILIKKLLQNLNFDVFVSTDTIRIKTSKNKLISLILFLKNHSLMKYNCLIDIVVIDKPGSLYRFNVNYVLLSPQFNTRIIVTTFANELNGVPSISHIFNGANWVEREVWDTFGVFFSNHSDLRRILNDYGFLGFPFRKDFPLSGFLDIRYQEKIKRFKYSAVSGHKFRKFQFNNSWNVV